MDRVRVAILGASGFAGAELLRRLLSHPAVDVVRAAAADHIGEPVARALPHLEGLTDLVFENPAPAEAASGADVVIMGLPHDVSVEVVRSVADRDVRLLDLSGAYRLKHAETYAAYYGGTHPSPDLLEEFVYGLPEVNRSALVGARRVASPGCFATAIQLGLLPFARAGLLAGGVEVTAITGSSGAGATPAATTHHPVRAGNVRAYRELSHPHEPEVAAGLSAAARAPVAVSFVPVAGPFVRGIFATSYFRVEAGLALADLRALQRDFFAGARFVRIPKHRLPEVVAVSGSNYAEVGVALGPVRDGQRTAVAFAALDNLVKGGAGQAVQNLNLMLGLDEATSLADPGHYP